MKYWRRLVHHLHWRRLHAARQRCLQQASLSPALRALFSSPLPSPDTPFSTLPMLAFDFETTGLDAEQDRILSVGCLNVQNAIITPQEGMHRYILDDRAVKAQTAVINHITPEMLTQGEALDEVMDNLFWRLVDRVPVVHGRRVEQQFILHYLRQRYGCTDFPVLWIDTLATEQRRRAFSQGDPGDVRLSTLRKQYHLPDYPAHHALYDALATAELLLAQVQARFQQREVALCQLYDL